jgi:DNA-binding SARP family transcriptional activator
VLEHKVTVPPTEGAIARPELVARARARQVALLTAPAGHGKTYLAAQVAAAAGGPVAWFNADDLDQDALALVEQVLAALGRAWPDAASPARTLTDDAAALPLLTATIETLAGPGCLVLDNADLVGRALLDAVVDAVLAALPSACHLVVCARDVVTPAIVRAEAARRAVIVGAGDLAFTVGECARVAGIDAEAAGELHRRTGGWPLAVALGSGTAGAAGVRHDTMSELALAGLPGTLRPSLAAMARVPDVPGEVLAAAGVTAPDDFARTHPAVIERLGDDRYAVRGWLRHALGAEAVDAAVVTDFAARLQAGGDDEMAAQLLLASDRPADAAPLVAALARGAAREGRWARVSALAARLPASDRSIELEILGARAAGVLGAPDEPALVDLVERTEGLAPSVALRARETLADHYRMVGDLRFLPVCEAALGDVLTAPEPDARLLERWPPTDASSGDAAAAAAEMLRFCGLGMLFGADRDTVERGRRLVAAAFSVARAIGRSVVSPQAWFLYAEALLYLRPAADVIPRIAAATRWLQERGHGDAAVRLAELAVLEYSAGELAAASRTVEIGLEWTDLTGYEIARPPLHAVAAAVDVVRGGPSPARLARLDDVLVEMAAHPRLAHYVPAYAAEFGILLAGRGDVDAAKRYLVQAEEPAPALVGHLWTLRSRRLRGLLDLTGDRAAEGRATLEALREEAAAQGRVALVELLDADLVQAPQRPTSAATAQASPLVTVRVLGTQLSATVEGAPVTGLRGYPAKLLALLVASGGVLTVDAAIEGLWPDADLATGRNRLHGILLRLRRTLGLPAGGPITCADDLVRLDRDGPLVVDSWELERPDAATGRPAAWQAVERYGDGVLTHQFAYDDTVEAYRRSTRAAFLRTASDLLADPATAPDPGAAVALARQVGKLAPDDESLCLLAVDVLVRAGHAAEAAALARSTERALAGLGIDPADFAAAARRLTSDLTTP